MASQKARKTTAAAVPGAPDPAVVKEASTQLLDRLQAQSAPPPGVVGAVPRGAPLAALGKIDLKKLTDQLMPVLWRIAAAAGDGKVTPTELVEIGVDIFERLTKRDGASPSPAA
jgi:hypothetical protein